MRQLVICSGRSNSKVYLYLYKISIDGSLVLPKAFPIDKEKPCSCTTCIVYVNLFKDRSFHDCCSFQKAGAKVRTLKHIFQIFSEVFFHFSFPRPKFRKKPMAKKRKMEAYRSVLLSECQNIAAFVPESGCKSRPFMDICKIYTRFF